MFSWIRPCRREDRKVIVTVGGIARGEFAKVRLEAGTSDTSLASSRNGTDTASSTTANSKSKKKQKKRDRGKKASNQPVNTPGAGDSPAEQKPLPKASLIPNDDQFSRRVLCWEMRASSERQIVYSLADAPLRFGRSGLDFASCVWRNCLYVSGGAARPLRFCRYQPWSNTWQDFGDVLPEGRLSHCMAAVDNRVYILGGFHRRTSGAGEETDAPASTPPLMPSSVVAYNIPRVGQTQPGTWQTAGHLLEPVAGACVAVRGHRIYVIGGKTQDA